MVFLIVKKSVDNLKYMVEINDLYVYVYYMY